MDIDTNQPLQALMCVKCGAALPAEAATGELVTCGYCGTAFKLPAARTHGGVSISGDSVTIGGDIVGGSKHVIVTGEPPSAMTNWDKPDTSNGKGVSIEGNGIQVCGDVVGGNTVKIERPAPKLSWREKIKRRFSN